MAVTSINSEDRLVQATFAEHLNRMLGWDSVYAWNQETFGPDGTLGPGRYQGSGADPRLARRRWNGSIPTCRLPPSTTRCGT